MEVPSKLIRFFYLLASAFYIVSGYHDLIFDIISVYLLKVM